MLLLYVLGGWPSEPTKTNGRILHLNKGIVVPCTDLVDDLFMNQTPVNKAQPKTKSMGSTSVMYLLGGYLLGVFQISIQFSPQGGVDVTSPTVCIVPPTNITMIRIHCSKSINILPDTGSSFDAFCPPKQREECKFHRKLWDLCTTAYHLDQTTFQICTAVQPPGCQSGIL